MVRFVVILFFALVVVACPSATIATRVFPRSADNSVLIPVTGAETFEGCGQVEIPVTNNEFEQLVIEQTNEIRMENGLAPLKRVDDLNRSARYHAADMSNNNYFSHDTYDRTGGDLSQVCDTWNRIESFYDDWLALAENIAAGQRSAQMAMDGWMNSPDHRHNILSDSYWEIGVGFYEGTGEYRFYWVQNFGRKTGSFPMVIAGEKAQTAARLVPIYIYGDWAEIRLRNDQGDWTEWHAFQNSFEWLLPETAGEHTVTAELRGAEGEAAASDTIILIP